jgi:ubiquinone/menaquinone biosynthesis C-methylase UbiE
MIAAAKAQISSKQVSFVVGDNRELPFPDGSLDTVINVNSFIPEQREDSDAMFEEAARVLRPGGRLVGILPAFEMSIAAVNAWGAATLIDAKTRREYDTTGWQSFYLEQDIDSQMSRLTFQSYRVERLVLDRPEEIQYVKEVYMSLLGNSPPGVVSAVPLFEHLLVAVR